MKKYVFFKFEIKSRSRKKGQRGYSGMVDTKTGEITANEYYVIRTWHDFYKPTRRGVKLNINDAVNDKPRTDEDLIIINARKAFAESGVTMNKKNFIFEIEWRKLLIKRLKSSKAVLKRDAAAEEKQIIEAKQLAAGYSSFEEAHEAFGWAYITEKQLDRIKDIFEDKQESQSRAALRRINDMIGNIEGEIKMLRLDPDYREEILQT